MHDSCWSLSGLWSLAKVFAVCALLRLSAAASLFAQEQAPPVARVPQAPPVKVADCGCSVDGVCDCVGVCKCARVARFNKFDSWAMDYHTATRYSAAVFIGVPARPVKWLVSYENKTYPGVVQPGIAVMVYYTDGTIRTAAFLPPNASDEDITRAAFPASAPTSVVSRAATVHCST